MHLNADGSTITHKRSGRKSSTPVSYRLAFQFIIASIGQIAITAVDLESTSHCSLLDPFSHHPTRM